MLKKIIFSFVTLLLWFLLYQWGDKAVALFFYMHQSNALNLILSAISDIFGKGWFYIAFFAVLWGISILVIARPRHSEGRSPTRHCEGQSPEAIQSAKKWFGFMTLWLIFSYAITFCLKMLIGQARPMLWIQDNIYGFFGPTFSPDYWALPSGHTTTCVALALGLGMRWPQYKRMLLVFALLLSFLRVILLQHYLSDILVTACLVVAEWRLVKRFT